MFVEDLERELGRLHLHPLTKVRLGAVFAEPDRVAVVDGDVVIGSELDQGDAVDWLCDELHVDDANIDACLRRIAEQWAGIDPGELVQRQAEALSIDDLLEWLVHRYRERVADQQRRAGFRRVVECLTGKRLEYRSGRWIVAAPWDAAVVSTRPL